MTIRSVSFDDINSSDLFVFSGYDLMLSHHDIADLDWGEIAERSQIDGRRGLVIAQVAALEEVIDEFIHYIEDPIDTEKLQKELDGTMLGGRVNRFEDGLEAIGLLDAAATELLEELRWAKDRRNQLAHGSLHCQLVGFPIPLDDLHKRDVELEWLLVDHRRKTRERVSMMGLREDLGRAAGVFSAALGYVEHFVRRAPVPTNYGGGTYIVVPAP